MKRILVLCFAAMLAGQVCGQESFEVGNLKYTVIEGTTNVSVSQGTTAPTGDLEINATVENGGVPYTVTEIGYEAFSRCNVTSITIPNSVTSIAERAFNYCNLSSIIIPNSVTEIAAEAFSSCLLTSITIPNSVTSIGEKAFEGSYIETLTYNTNAVGTMFSGMSSLKTVNIGDAVTEIAAEAFSGCLLTSITIPNSVTSIGEKAFWNCCILTSITIPESVISFSNSAFAGCPVETLTYNTNAIGKAFSNNLYLKTVNIGSAVTEIADEAFMDCSNLTSVTIGNSVTSIGYSAFRNCRSLSSIAIPNSVTSIGGKAFENCDGLTSVTIGNSVTSIGGFAFYGCSGLTSITIPESITNIGDIGENAFSLCENLETVSYNSNIDIARILGYLNKVKTINIGNNVTIIPKRAFGPCRKLTTINIPNSVTTIGDQAFAGCESLKSIDIPESVTSIGNNVFGTIFIPGENEYASCELESLTYNTNAIGNCFWGMVTLKHVNIGSAVTEIADGAFAACRYLTSITIPETITYIGDNAFRGCNGLTSVTIETDADVSNAGLTFTKDGVKYDVLTKNTADISGYNFPDDFSGNLVIPSTVIAGNEFSVSTIKENAFDGCTSITSITIPETITSIGDEAFAGCNNIETLTYNTNAVGAQFSGKSSLKTVNIGDAVTVIADNAFRGCGRLTSVTIPNSVTSVSDNAFEHCYNIQTLTYNTNAIGDAFRGMPSLKTVNIGDAVTGIADYAFEDCSGLTSVTIPNSVTNIGDNAFNNCGSLSSIIIESDADFSQSGLNIWKGNTMYYFKVLSKSTVEIVHDWMQDIDGELIISATVEAGKTFTVTSIGDEAFQECRGLTSVVIPNTVTSIGDYAFSECGNLESVTIPESVTSIGIGAFEDCPLEQVTIPESVTSIGNNAFGEVEIVIYSGTATGAPWGAFGVVAVIDENGFAYSDKEKTQLVYYFGNSQNITIPNSVTSIGNYVFVRSNITTVIIPNSVTSIGIGAFEDCPLEQVTIPESVTSFGNNVFRGSKIETLTYNTNAVGAMFSGMSSLKTVNIGNAVTTIADNAFRGCGLTTITIPESVTSIGNRVFDNCPIETLRYNTNAVGRQFSGKSSLKTVNIGDAVTEITDYAFYDCGGLTSVTIGNSVASIGDNAFSDCSLTSVTIPESVASIGDNAFGGNNLSSITIESDADFSNAGLSFTKDGVSYNVLSRDAVKLIGGINNSTEVIIPAIVEAGSNFSITSIANNAFANCTNVTSVIINNDADFSNAGLKFKKDGISYSVLSKNTVEMGNNNSNHGFYDFDDPFFDEWFNDEPSNSDENEITELVIPATVTAGNTFTIIRICNNAFVNYKNLTSVTIETDADFSNAGLSFSKDGVRYNVLSRDAVKLIGGIRNTNEVVIPATVEAGSIFSITSIEDYAFENCTNLTSVIINSDADFSNAGLHFTKDDISYDVLSRSTAKLTNGASFSGDLVLPETVTAGNTFTITGIGDYAFAGNNSLTSVTLPEWVTIIGNGAFEDCNNIETLTYNTDAVGTQFSGLLSLRAVNIGDAVTRLESGAFAGCENLEQVSVGNGIESIGDNVFAGCESLDYNIYSNGYYLGNSQNPNMILMSARNMNITSCTVSGDCRFICDGAFRDCKKLAEVVLPESLTRVNNGLFAGCSSLRSVVIPESVTAIGDESFKGCSSLTEIKIPVSVTTIGSSAFEGCSGLSALTIPDGVISVSNNAFDGCTGLESVVIGKSVAEFSSGIFANCNGLKSIICHAETPIKLKGDPFLFNDTIYVPAASVDAYKAATVWKRKDIMPFYKVKILSANEALGTAEGDTLILGDHAATLKATPAEGYHFVRWSDNNTESPRAFAATKDTVLTAYFEAHTTVTDLAVAVTCEAFGLTEGSHCPGCGHVFVKQDTLPATGHTVVVDEAVPVTCTTAGKTEGKHCSVCNEVLTAQEEIAAPGHTVVVDLAKPATCTVTGWTDGKHCSVCNAVLVEQKEVPAFGHEFGAYVYNNDATTELDGTETALCKHGCGASVSRVAVGTKLSETPGEGSSTAVEESAADEVSIYAHHNVIVVENADAEIHVYDAMGRLIVETPHCDVSTEIRMNTAGIYIVRVGSVAKRVMVNE